MFFKREGKPEKGELVLCTVKKILPHAAFVILDEYDHLEAMLHVSEISSRWVKNIKEYISVGKKIVCKVLEVKPNGHIDVSLKRVTSAETKRKLNEIKVEQRTEKLIEAIARKLKEDPKKGLEKVGKVILDEVGSLADFSYAVKKEGAEIINELNLQEKWKKELYEQISEQLKSQFVKLCRNLEVKSLEGDGVKHIKKLFEKIYDFAKKNEFSVDIKYVSAPIYTLEISAKNYKKGETFFDKLIKSISKIAEKQKVSFKVVGDCK